MLVVRMGVEVGVVVLLLQLLLTLLAGKAISLPLLEPKYSSSLGRSPRRCPCRGSDGRESVRLWAASSLSSSSLLSPPPPSSAPAPAPAAAAASAAKEIDERPLPLPSTSPGAAAAAASSSSSSSTGIYVHLPFCRRRCRYCSFAVIVSSSTDNGRGSGNNTIKGGTSRNPSNASSDIPPPPAVDLMRIYTDALLKEIELTSSLFDDRAHKMIDDNTTAASIADSSITSVYFGGGTPSLLPLPLLEEIVRCLRRSFGERIDKGAEWTLEVDPGTLQREELRTVLNDLGFTRISLGVQSLNDTILSYLGRQHTSGEAADMVRMVRDELGMMTNRKQNSERKREKAKDQRWGDNDGCDAPRRQDLYSFSVDLISGLPGLTVEEWNQTLRRVVDDWDPPHISLYDLQVEDGTPFGVWYSGAGAGSSGGGRLTSDFNGSSSTPSPTSPPARQFQFLALPHEDESASMYRWASDFLRSRGYEHYEVSSYAKCLPTQQPQPSLPQMALSSSSSSSFSSPSPSPFRSRHNQLYWSADGSWYAFGLGSTSYMGGKAVVRPRALSDYLLWVRDMETTRLGKGKNPGSTERVSIQPPDPATVAAPDPPSLLDAIENLVLKRLRTREGLDLLDVESRFGQPAVKAILRGSRQAREFKLAVLEEEEEQEENEGEGVKSSRLRLAIPDGFLLSNSILSSLFAELEELYRDQEEEGGQLLL